VSSTTAEWAKVERRVSEENTCQLRSIIVTRKTSELCVREGMSDCGTVPVCTYRLPFRSDLHANILRDDKYFISLNPCRSSQSRLRARKARCAVTV
jgi:hypothetical protein